MYPSTNLSKLYVDMFKFYQVYQVNHEYNIEHRESFREALFLIYTK